MSIPGRAVLGRTRVLQSLNLFVLLAAAVAGHPACAQTAASLDCGLEAGPTRAVAEVIDGDTLRLDDGKEVRLIGLIAPRGDDVAARRGTWPPEEASRNALAAQLTGQTVSLAFLGPRSDRYGRVLAHLFLVTDSLTTWVEAEHLEAGHARAFAPPGQDGCYAHLLARERTARNAVRGLWGNAAYQVRPADRPGELDRYQATFQIVAGRVAKMGGTRTLVLLDFVNSEASAAPAPPNATGSRNRAAFRALWNRSVRSMPGGRAGLADTNLEVRGWIERRRGPEIKILGPSQIEIMPEVVTQKARAPETAPDAASPHEQRPAGEPAGR